MVKIRKTHAWESAAFGDLEPRCLLSARDAINTGGRQGNIIVVLPWIRLAARTVEERASITNGEQPAARMGLGAGDTCDETCPALRVQVDAWSAADGDLYRHLPVLDDRRVRSAGSNIHAGCAMRMDANQVRPKLLGLFGPFRDTLLVASAASSEIILEKEIRKQG